MEFDRLMKGWFFQALLLKWQQKLGASKAEETALWQGKDVGKAWLQYVASAAVRKYTTKTTANPTDQKGDKNKNQEESARKKINSRRPTRHPVKQPPLKKVVVLLQYRSPLATLPVQDSLTQG